MSGAEKQAIERATAELFLMLYNQTNGHTYRIVGQPHPPEPDVLCEDDTGARLKLEITMLQDRPGDIAALLGRSGAHTLEKLKADNERMARGELDPSDTVAFFGRDASADLYARLKAKLGKKYPGPDVALVMRGTSPLDWDWDLYKDDIRRMVDAVRAEWGLCQPPFDRGIWIVAAEASGVRLYTVAEERRDS